MIYEAIKKLVNYAIARDLISEYDRNYTTNSIIDVLKLDEFIDSGIKKSGESGSTDLGSDDTESEELESILRIIIDFAADKNILNGESITERDLFDARVMGLLVKRPSDIINKFWSEYALSPEKSTNYFYKLSIDSDYIRSYRIKKDLKWKYDSKYGELDITINLSKPEKDPREIAKAKEAVSVSYPKCFLCKENEGYAGRLNHPARQNIRLIPIHLNDELWYMQYSPYVYYNEHSILLNKDHVPMRIGRETFIRLLNFVEQFPHYFIGSNADLPIVGGSILSHDHFQGGRYVFAMENAENVKTFSLDKFGSVSCSTIKWPMFTLRLNSKSKTDIINASEHILNAWKNHSDESVGIFSNTDGEPHSTITPIARMRGDEFEMDLVLRNNITTRERPMGVFHPSEKLHNIKKENIGLIEVMGLAVLPSRLKNELEEVSAAILEKNDISKLDNIKKHADWVSSFVKKYDDLNEGNIESILQKEVGSVFENVLEDAGVFKDDTEGRIAANRFIEFIKRG